MATDSTLLAEYRAIKKEFARHQTKAEASHLPLNMVVGRNRADSIKTEVEDIIMRASLLPENGTTRKIIREATQMQEQLTEALSPQF